MLIASILALMLDARAKDFSAILSMGVCAMVGVMTLSHLAPVLDFLRELEGAAGMEPEAMGILLKSVGIGAAAELMGVLCADAGKSSLGKSIQMLGSAAILSLSLPLFRLLLTIIREILFL